MCSVGRQMLLPKRIHMIHLSTDRTQSVILIFDSVNKALAGVLLKRHSSSVQLVCCLRVKYILLFI